MSQPNVSLLIFSHQAVLKQQNHLSPDFKLNGSWTHDCRLALGQFQQRFGLQPTGDLFQPSSKAKLPEGYAFLLLDRSYALVPTTGTEEFVDSFFADYEAYVRDVFGREIHISETAKTSAVKAVEAAVGNTATVQTVLAAVAAAQVEAPAVQEPATPAAPAAEVKPDAAPEQAAAEDVKSAEVAADTAQAPADGEEAAAPAPEQAAQEQADTAPAADAAPQDSADKAE